jgi:hypothetical protein
MNTWSRTRLSCTLRPANGPYPRTVPQTAMMTMVTMAAAVSRCPKRSAAQITSGKTA